MNQSSARTSRTSVPARAAEQIECKGKIRTIEGRLAGACTTDKRGILTYLAIPDNLRFGEQLVGIIDYCSLPIGLLFLANDGAVTMKKRAT
jgi:hypothetical protein